MSVIDEYFKKLDPDKKIALQRLRNIGLKVVPDAQETIGYGMPTLKYKGKAFLGFDVHKSHIGIYPYGSEPITVFKDKLKDYGLTKGAIQVPFNKEFPKDLLTEIIKFKIKKIKEEQQ